MATNNYSFSAKRREDRDLIQALKAQAELSGRTFSFYVLQGLHLLKDKEAADDAKTK